MPPTHATRRSEAVPLQWALWRLEKGLFAPGGELHTFTKLVTLAGVTLHADGHTATLRSGMASWVKCAALFPALRCAPGWRLPLIELPWKDSDRRGSG